MDVDFPFEAYPCQLVYMSKVIEALQSSQNALLESPTGTGKTLCLLCATLAWQQSLVQSKVQCLHQSSHLSQVMQGPGTSNAELKAERREHEDEGLPTIIYASRTHSQLAQVMKELKVTGYKPKTSILGSRQQSCLHPVVSKMTGASANQACRSLIAKRGCKWHFGVEKFSKANPDANLEVMDIEDIVNLGSTRTICPYFLSREMASNAELIFMPYNYLIDSRNRAGLGIRWERAVLIFDEAHNIENACSDAASFDLPSSILAGSIEEIGAAADLASLKDDGPKSLYNSAGDNGVVCSADWPQLAADFRRLQLVLQKLEHEIAALKVPSGSEGFTAPGAFLFQLFAKINLTEATYPMMASTLESAIELLSADSLDNGRKFGARSSNYKLHGLAEAFRLAFNTAKPVKPGLPPSYLGYRVHVHMEKSKNDRLLPVLSFWCFDPGQSMMQLTALNIRSILLTSGTLSPLNSFAQELGIPFNLRLENPHVIDRSQVWVGVVSSGPSGHQLNSSYQTRDTYGYKEDLGNAIVNFARIIPDGVLVFFPSYAVLKNCIEFWKSPRNFNVSSIWDNICQLKATVMEPRETALFSVAAADFLDKLNGPMRGAVLFAVSRGKASEGLDFSDRAGRAVIITGIPYATKTDPKVKIKQAVLDDHNRSQHKRKVEGHEQQYMTGDEWYVQQALRAVNQAMGRVIRHINDFGAILLCDERFGSESTRRQLSRWLRDEVVKYPNFGAAAASLNTFFKKHAGTSSLATGAKAKSIPFVNAVEDRSQPKAARRLLDTVPAAADVVSIADLIGGLGQQNEVLQKSITLLDTLNHPVSHQQSTSLVENLSEVKASAAKVAQTAKPPLACKPWEKQLLSASTRLKNPSRVGIPVVKPSNAASLAPFAIGPGHLVEKYRDRVVEDEKKILNGNQAGKLLFPRMRLDKAPPEKTLPKEDRSIYFLTELKHALPEQDNMVVVNALKHFAKDRDEAKLMAIVFPVLEEPGRAKLMEMFKKFLPRRKPTGVQQTAVVAAGVCTCSICKKTPMEGAHEAACGHVACYSCWMRALALFKCPICGKGIRKQQLVQKYFH